MGGGRPVGQCSRHASVVLGSGMSAQAWWCGEQKKIGMGGGRLAGCCSRRASVVPGSAMCTEVQDAHFVESMTV